ncbi:MAG: FkbM family methyltransferase [Alphaproteobacteria bacterium]|nr:FkbM family methyltransferase [Alphaproteobacteria bacterium]
MLALITRLRHGPLSHFSGWTVAGRAYRSLQHRLGWPRSASKRVGRYGPFQLDGRFAFSDYGNWGKGHNSGFETCIELCRGKKCVLDIGAHIGLVSLPVSSVLAAGGRVFAFEPAEGNLHYLRRHVSLNRFANVEVVDCLVGSVERDEVSFFEEGGDSGLNSMARPTRTGFAETKRRQVTVDGFCASRSLQPDVIKIDVEGAELDVLRGARNVLGFVRPRIVLSVHPRHMTAMGASVAELERFIRDCSYTVTTVAGGSASTLEFGEYLLNPSEEVAP